METRSLLRVLLGGMAVVGCVLVACVGDDPNAGPPVGADGGGGTDGTTPDTDSATADTGTTTDAGTDGYVPPPPATGDVKWVSALGDAGAATDYGSAVAVDSKGNVIVCGRFAATIDVGCAAPLVPVDTTYGDVSVVKYDPTGKCTWAQRIGGDSSDQASVCVVGPNDEIYVGGQTYSSTWNVGTGASIPGATGFTDIFLVRLKADGTGADWAKSWGEDNTSDSVVGIAVHPTKNRVAIVGTTAKSSNALSFDTAQMAAPGGAISGIGFVAELDSTTGAAQWLRGVIRDTANVRAGSSNLRGVAYDSQGNVIVSGTINTGADPTTQAVTPGAWFHDYPDTSKQIVLHQSKSSEVIVLKYDPLLSGKIVWADNVKMSTGSYNASRADGIALDATNRVYVPMTYHNSISFNGGGNLPGSGLDENVGVLTIDANGSVVAARGWGSPQFDWINGFARDRWGNFVLVGGTKGSMDFGKNVVAHQAPGTDTFDSFVVKLDPNLDTLWARQFGSTDEDQAQAAAFGPGGEVAVVGSFTGLITFPNAATRTANGASDGYVLFLSP